MQSSSVDLLIRKPKISSKQLPQPIAQMANTRPPPPPASLYLFSFLARLPPLLRAERNVTNVFLLLSVSKATFDRRSLILGDVHAASFYSTR